MGRLRKALSILRHGDNEKPGATGPYQASGSRGVNEDESSLTPVWSVISAGPLEGRQLLFPPNPAWQGITAGNYEAFIFSTISEYKDFDSAVVWDVGAFIGYHALAFASLVGEHGRVITFEPNPHNVERIQQHLTKNPDLASRITLMTEALSDRDGEESFVFSPEPDLGSSSGSHIGGSLAPEEQDVYETFERMVVPSVRADTLLRTGRIPTPSIIKMDVEGAELLVLKGGIEMLKVAKPLLLVEVHHIVAMFYVQRLLTNLGYEIEIVDEEHSPASRCHIVARPAGH